MCIVNVNVLWMHISLGTDSRRTVVAVVSVVALPMILDQIVDSFHSLVLSGVCEAPVTLKHHEAWMGWWLCRLRLNLITIHSAQLLYRPRQDTSDDVMMLHDPALDVVECLEIGVCVCSMFRSNYCLSTAAVCLLVAVERVKAPGRCLEPESVEPQSNMGTTVSTATV